MIISGKEEGEKLDKCSNVMTGEKGRGGYETIIDTGGGGEGTLFFDQTDALIWGFFFLGGEGVGESKINPFMLELKE